MNITAIITAGGSSSRYKGGNKLLQSLNGRPVIMHSVETFSGINSIDEIIIAASKELIPDLELLIKGWKNIKVVQGGKTRQESVFNALKACNNCDMVLIHDGARPLIEKDTIIKSIEKTKKLRATAVGVKTVDTIKIADADLKIIETPNRETLWNIQTPQTFDFNLIFDAHKQFEGKNFTDDSALLENLGISVYIIEGEYSNFKITTNEDILKAELLLKANM